MKKFFYFLIFSFFISPLALHAEDWPGDDTGVDIASGVTGSFEASGVSWYLDSEGQAKVVAVSDQSGGSAHLCTLNLDGSDVNCADVSSCDLESVVVVDSQSSTVYIGCEGDGSNSNEIREFDLEAMDVTGNTWTLPESFRASSGFESYNMEALTFVPDEFLPSDYSSTSGGLFCASLQVSSSIVVFDVDLSSPGRVTEVDSFIPTGGTTDMGDMYFSVETGLLYVLYDGANLLLEVNPETKETLHSYTIPTVSTPDDEGFALIADCDTSLATVLIADDTQTSAVAELYVYENYPVTCLVSSTDGSGSSGSSSGSDTTSGGSDGSDTGSGYTGTDTSGSATSGSETTGSESGGTSGGSTTSESSGGESSGSDSSSGSSSTTGGSTEGTSETSSKSGSFFTAPGCSLRI